MSKPARGEEYLPQLDFAQAKYTSMGNHNQILFSGHSAHIWLILPTFGLEKSLLFNIWK